MELNKEKGVHIHLDRTGRASGEAFVQFESTEDCEKALKRNMEKIGHRWVGSWFGSCYVAILDTKSIDTKLCHKKFFNWGGNTLFYSLIFLNYVFFLKKNNFYFKLKLMLISPWWQHNL